jgi:prepilin signal peptidase PulO-like enzyme (type II secretory pathway)
MELGLTILTWVVRFFVGIAAGVMINYFADVLPKTRRFTQPVCQACDQSLSIKDYLLLRNCPECGKWKRARSIIVLLAAETASILLAIFPFAGLNYWVSVPILVFLGVIIVIDIEHRLVLYETSLVGVALFLIYGIVLRGIVATLSGGLGGFAIMMVFYLTGLLFVKILGRIRNREIKEVAFGFGDVAAGTFLGLFTGWPVILGAVIIAFIAFGIYSLLVLLALLVTKKYRAFSNALPFAPFLVLGVIVIYYL